MNSNLNPLNIYLGQESFIELPNLNNATKSHKSGFEFKPQHMHQYIRNHTGRIYARNGKSVHKANCHWFLLLFINRNSCSLASEVLSYFLCPWMELMELCMHSFKMLQKILNKCFSVFSCNGSCRKTGGPKNGAVINVFFY